MFVGGEFYEDRRWETGAATITTEHMMFLNGGGACLRVIAAILLKQGIGEILLPSYLCPSIISRLERCGIKLGHYQIREDLSIDLEDLDQKCQPHSAIYVINYFGFTHAPDTLAYLEQRKLKGAPIVEDNVQGGFFMPSCGDFVFNSLRKLCPYDGGYLYSIQSKAEIPISLQSLLSLPNRRLPLIRSYRQQLAAYLLRGQGRHSDLQRLLGQAERVYEEDDVLMGDALEQVAIEQLDWPAIRRIRRENYTHLLSLIASIPGVRPIFPALQSGILPLGLPVYLENISRDAVCQQLARNQIGLTVHWDEILNHPVTSRNARAAAMAKKMVTLPIDQRFDASHMEYLALKLAGAMAMG